VNGRRGADDLDAIAVVTALVCGTLVPSPEWAPGTLMVGGGLAIAVLLGRRSRAVVLVVLCIVAFAAGGVAMRRAVAGLREPALVAAERSDSVIATVVLTDDPVRQPFSARAMARITRLQTGATTRAVHRSVLVNATGLAATRLALLEAGDTAVLEGRLQSLDRHEEASRWRHAAARLSARDLLDARRSRSPLARAAHATRALITRGLDGRGNPTAGLLAGFLIGDRRGIAARTSDDFRAAGLSHLLVVSGENVAFILIIVGPVLRRLPLVGRLVAGSAVLVVFGAATRWEPSVLRAIAMAVVTLTAHVLGRPVSAGRALCLAVGVLLLADPFLVHSIGFELSCGACAGIALLAPALRTHLPGPAWVRDSLAVTAAAQIGVAPVLIPAFGALPAVALPANLVVAPAVGPITILGLAGAALSGALRGVSPAARAFVFPALALTRAVSLVASAAARIPLAITAHGAVVLLAAAGCIVAARRFARLRRLPSDR